LNYKNYKVTIFPNIVDELLQTYDAAHEENYHKCRIKLSCWPTACSGQLNLLS